MYYLIDSLFYYIGMAFITISVAKLIRLKRFVSSIQELEKALIIAIKILGVIYLFYVSLSLYLSDFQLIKNGPYYPYLFGISYIFILTQMFWVKKLAKSYLFKFIAGFSFIIEFEKFVIILTSLHRDYTSFNWLYTSFLLSKVIGFLITIFVFFLIDRFWLKNSK